MDVGFGLIEAGSVRTKNTTHILVKNILDSCKKHLNVNIEVDPILKSYLKFCVV